MTVPSRHIKLSEPDRQSMRFLTGSHVSLGEKDQSVVTVLRTGTFFHPEYGSFDVTKSLFESFVKNFDAGVYGQRIFIDVAHDPKKGSAGEVVKMFIDGNRLRLSVKWTEYGIKAIKERGFIYLSADYVENYVDNETGEVYDAVFRGAGLVTRPHIKRMDAIQLSSDELGDARVYVCQNFIKTLSEEAQVKMNKYLEALKKALAEKKLNKSASKQLCEQFEAQAKALGDDDAQLSALQKSFEVLGDTIVTQLAEQGVSGDKPVQITLEAPKTEGKGLSINDVERMLAEREQKQAEQRQQQAVTLKENTDAYAAAIDGATGLGEPVKKQLKEAAGGLITHTMTAEQSKRLAESQIAVANQFSAASQLQQMGFTVAGSPSITLGDQSIKALQETYMDKLSQTSAFANRQLRLHKEANAFTNIVLAEFDRIHGARLAQEARVLAGEETNIGDTALPVGVQRQVIREALSDLRVLELVQTLTDPTAQATTQIPYEQRDTGSVKNNGIVFEGQGIHGASIRQKMDLAYILPKKLAMKLSNEVMHFTRASAINWDAYARNVASNARVMRELVVALLANEMQRAADAYGALDVSGENIAARLDGSNSVIKTAQFPVVRPHQDYDLQGTTIGSAENEITLVVDGTTITEYDGTGTQAAGTYYKLTSLNLGYITLVNQAGVAQTPNASTATISYSYATNVVKWDSDTPNGSTYEAHLNKLLQQIGARKAMLSGDRFVMPDFLLMSPTLNDTITNAEQFERDSQRAGSDLNGSGDLATVKALPAFSTNAPNIDLGDERVFIGQRATTSYVIAKPFITGTPFEAVDANGKPTGEKVAYGEEYSAIKTPVPIRNRATGVIVYSATARAAA